MIVGNKAQQTWPEPVNKVVTTISRAFRLRRLFHYNSADDMMLECSASFWPVTADVRDVIAPVVECCNDVFVA